MAAAKASYFIFMCLSFCEMGIKTPPTAKVVGRNAFSKYLLSIYHVFVEHLLCARHCFRHKEFSNEQNIKKKTLPVWSLYSSGGRWIISKIN